MENDSSLARSTPGPALALRLFSFGYVRVVRWQSRCFVYVRGFESAGFDFYHLI